MMFNHFTRGVVLFVVTFLLLLAPALFAQSLTTGDIAGTLKDPSGAVVPNATVTLKSLDTGATQSSTTDSTGEFRFRLLKTGQYMVSTSPAGFQKTEQQAEVTVGSVMTLTLTLTVGQSTQTVEVSATAPLLNPEPSNNTPFSPQQLAQLPAAGGDITTIAYTVPGVTVNVTGGYGNFSLNGLPGTSNLFTVNGENDMDPYFNINNSGASNLTIGQNELQEATVIANPYSGQYGQLAGAQVSYVTKSGTNQFHGNAQWLWNGRAMNSNDWFSNAYGSPRPFSNDNQWAASIGGPIRKDKTFFFFDYEGLKFVLPNEDTETIPTPAFSTAVLNNVTNVQPAEASAYKTMLGLWANAPGAASAVTIPNISYCNTVVLPGYNGATTPCAERFVTNPSAKGSEYILAFKIDQKIGTNDNASFRYKDDQGLQPTTLDPISPNFDALSNQPAYDMQFQETHIFSSRSTNQFTASFSHYVAQFAQNAQLVQSTFPYQVATSGAVPFSGFNSQGSFPQGRNITQYQFFDDLTLTRGRHNFKFGFNFRRYDVSDHNFFWNNPGAYFGYTSNGLQNFVNGIAYQYRKYDNAYADVPIAMWGLGVYAQDEWAAASNLKFTFALRAERNSNPVCQFNCFANLNGPAAGLASFTSSNPGSVPYSSDITPGQHQAYPGVDAVVWSPRVGFSYSPGSDHKTVISGGFMLAYDNPPAGLVDDLTENNPPSTVALRIRPPAGTLPFDPKGALATWQASVNAFSLNKTFSQLSSQLAALGSVFSAPSVFGLDGTIKAPMWREWNLQVQRQLNNSMLLTVNYVGNSGTRLLYTNAWPNAYDEYGLYPGVKGIPSSPPVGNYLVVTNVQNGAVSNYEGLNVTITKRFSDSVAFHFNYTWSHNLDECSNGCLFGDGNGGQGQINPLSLRADNYGNADYDIRNNFTGDFLVNPTIKSGSRALKAVVNGWQFSGKLFWRTGIPYNVFDTNDSALGNGGGTIFATPLGRGWGGSSCGSANAYTGGAINPCLNANVYLDTTAATFTNFTQWSPQTRNQLHGPHFFDMDLNLFRNFHFTERASLGIGVQAFNAFNHPNFGNPDSTIGDPTFGTLGGMVSPTTSVYGSFLGFDSSVRVVQLSAKILF